MTAVLNESQTYAERLQTLSEASVHLHFDAFLDIDWDHPDYAIDPTDERWVLPEADVLGPPPLVPGAAEGRADPDRALPAGQRHQGRPPVRAGPDRRPDELRALAAQRLARVPLRHPRGDRGVPPHPDVPGVREPLRRRTSSGGSRLFRALAPILPLAAGSCRSASSSACWPARSRSTTCRSRSCARATRCTRCCSGSCRSTSPRRPATSGSPTSTSSTRRRGSSGTSAPCSRSSCRSIMRWLCDEILVPSRKARRDMGLPTTRRQGPLLGAAGVAEDAARPLRRRPDARRATPA